MARDSLDDASRAIADGLDPAEIRKEQKQQERTLTSFEAVARKWFNKFKLNWIDSHANRIWRRFEKDIFPWIGKLPISEIAPLELLNCLRRIEERGAVESAHRAMRACSQVFRYAVASGYAQRDPSIDLKGAIPPSKVVHHASITDPQKIGALLRTIDGYEGSFIVRCALKLAPLFFVRPGELRHAEWSEFNFADKEWRIPAEKMKMRIQHIVPLSTQAIDILLELKPYTNDSTYVFPSPRSPERPMSENTFLGALRRLGYSKDEMTGHGFRSMASTLLNEQGYHPDAIERQLAHAEQSKVRAAYNYAKYMPEHRKMMQQWADYLDALKNSATIVR